MPIGQLNDHPLRLYLFAKFRKPKVTVSFGPYFNQCRLVNSVTIRFRFCANSPRTLPFNNMLFTVRDLPIEKSGS